MELGVATIRGNSPGFKVTLDSEATLEMSSDLRVNGQNYIPFPGGNGTTDRNPDPIMGSLRFNTDGSYLEIWTGSLWKPL